MTVTEEDVDETDSWMQMSKRVNQSKNSDSEAINQEEWPKLGCQVGSLPDEKFSSGEQAMRTQQEPIFIKNEKSSKTVPLKNGPNFLNEV